MALIQDVDATEFIQKTVEALKKTNEIKMPKWAMTVKTGAGKERPPTNLDWWYFRAASVLRKIYLNNHPIGVSRLRRRYSAKKNRGHKRERVYAGSGKIIRTILQQLDKEGLTQKVEKGEHKGRLLTPKGKSFLHKLAK